MPNAFVLGGGGQVGRAVARRFLDDGWDVTVGTRTGHAVDEAAGVAVDRVEPGALEAVLGDGVDLLVDCICYHQDEADQLLRVGDRVGALVVLSSVSVYADEQGRSLDEADTPEAYPRFPVPICEDVATVPPGPDTYSTQKVAMERRLLGQDRVPVTVLRPGAIHGPHSVHAREWYFLKRAVDRRPIVVLAHRGESRFHPTGVANLAEAVLAAARHPGRGVFNIVDPDCPTVREIGQAVAAFAQHQPVEVLLPGPPVGPVGSSPWATPHPVVASTTRAQELLGYAPVKTYTEQLADDLAWLLEATAVDEWRKVLPDLANNYRVDFFDYAAEDAYLDARSPIS